MEKIEYVGLSDLKSEVLDIQSYVRTITENYYSRISNAVEIEGFKVTIKEYSKGGKARKYSVHVHLKAGKAKLKAEASEWDISKAMHKVLKEIENQVLHRFKK